jgi:hypothetical protein
MYQDFFGYDYDVESARLELPPGRYLRAGERNARDGDYKRVSLKER